MFLHVPHCVFGGLRVFVRCADPSKPIFDLPVDFWFPFGNSRKMCKNRIFEFFPNRFFIDGIDQISTKQVYLTPLSTFATIRSPRLVISMSGWLLGSAVSGLLPDADRFCPKFLKILDKCAKIEIFNFAQLVFSSMVSTKLVLNKCI